MLRYALPISVVMETTSTSGVSLKGVGLIDQVELFLGKELSVIGREVENWAVLVAHTTRYGVLQALHLDKQRVFVPEHRTDWQISNYIQGNMV